MARLSETEDPDFPLHDRTPVLDRSGLSGRLDKAIDERRRVELVYAAAPNAVTKRTVRPLGLFPGDDTWRLLAWCETREDFRMFRLDRVRSLRVRSDSFPDEPGRRFEDYVVWV